MFYSPVITNAAEAAQNKDFHLFTYVEDPDQFKIDTYVAHNGYQVWKNVLEIPKETTLPRKVDLWPALAARNKNSRDKTNCS